jgi:hypothetical protein
MAADGYRDQIAALELEPDSGAFSLKDFVCNYCFYERAILAEKPACDPDFVMIASGDTTLGHLYVQRAKDTLFDECMHFTRNRYWTVNGYVLINVNTTLFIFTRESAAAAAV